MASPNIKKRNKITLVGDSEMYQQLLQTVDDLKSEFAKQGQKYTSLEILNFSVTQLNSKLNVHQLPETTDCNRNNASEDLVITTISAAENLMKIAGTHGSICDKHIHVIPPSSSGRLQEMSHRIDQNSSKYTYFSYKIQSLPEMDQEVSYIFYTFFKNLPEMKEKSP